MRLRKKYNMTAKAFIIFPMSQIAPEKKSKVNAR